MSRYILDNGCFSRNKRVQMPKLDDNCRAHKRENAYECQALCKQTSDCTAFTYATNKHSNEEKKKNCCLKGGSWGNLTEIDHVISGPVTCPGTLIYSQRLSFKVAVWFFEILKSCWLVFDDIWNIRLSEIISHYQKFIYYLKGRNFRGN